MKLLQKKNIEELQNDSLENLSSYDLVRVAKNNLDKAVEILKKSDLHKKLWNTSLQSENDYASMVENVPPQMLPEWSARQIGLFIIANLHPKTAQYVLDNKDSFNFYPEQWKKLEAAVERRSLHFSAAM